MGEWHKMKPAVRCTVKITTTKEFNTFNAGNQYKIYEVDLSGLTCNRTIQSFRREMNICNWQLRFPEDTNITWSINYTKEEIKWSQNPSSTVILIMI